MKTQNTNPQPVNVLAMLTPEQLEALSPEQIAALASMAPAAAGNDLAQTPEAPKAPKAPKTITAHSAKHEYAAEGFATDAGFVDPDAWVSYRTADGPHMGKAKNMPKDARDVKTHANQGKALQRVNAMNKATEAPAPEAPKPEAAPAPWMETTLTNDRDELAARRDAKNAAMIATIPEENRRAVENKLKQLHKAGYRYARLERNRKHQLDGLHIYPGEKGRGREAAFKECTTKKAQEWRERADEALKNGQPRIKPLSKTFVWSHVGGGNLYARGIFGPITEA